MSADEYQFRQVRKQNRKLHKGIRSHIRNKAGRLLFGFRQWDMVRYDGVDTTSSRVVVHQVISAYLTFMAREQH